MREQPWIRHVSHQMTTLVLAHKDDNAILEPCALVARSAPVNKLYCTDVSCEWVSLSTLPVDFLEFLQRNRNHHHISDDVDCHELQLACHCESCHCDVEDEDAASGFPVAPCSTAIQFSDRHSNRSFLLFRIADRC